MNARRTVPISSCALLGAVLTFAGCAEFSLPSTAAVSRAGSTLDQVRGIAANNLNIDPAEVRGTTSLGELGADDLDFVELILTLEQHFNISIPDDDAERLLGDDTEEGLRRVTMTKLAALVDARR